jgi:hypothetical protein
MNPQSRQILVELLLRAVDDGPAEAPAVVERMLRELTSRAAPALSLETDALEKEAAEEFSVWEVFYSRKTLEPEQAERWVNALRWLLQELKSWTPGVAHPWIRLQILLAALSAFEPVTIDASVVFQQFRGSRLPEGLCQLLERAQIRANDTGNSAFEEIQAAVQAGDYPQLQILTRHLDVFLPPDIRLAIYLLCRIHPEFLAELIKQRKDAILSYAISNVLADSAHEFALSVDETTFKFFSVAKIADWELERAPAGMVAVLCKLLIQIANSDHWQSCLEALFKYPKGNRVSEQALSRALAQLEPAHWKSFVAAVELWTHLGTVWPVANILIHFHEAAGAPAAREMWLQAFRRWNHWDYGRADKDKYMFAPAACSFDFPVAMYYAHLSAEELMAEEEVLVAAVASIEQTWFSSESHLITHRNRLLSRLRLVRHGQALASGAIEPLPPLPQVDGEYAVLRYRYLDVNSPTRMSGQ